MNGIDLHIILPYLPLLWKGVLVTVKLALIGLLLSGLLGIVLSVGLMVRSRWVSMPLSAYVELMRNTPELAQLFWIYLVLPYFGIALDPYQAALVFLVANGAAYTAEIFRGGIQAVEPGQWDACRSLGLSWYDSFRRVILPQGFQKVLPSLTNQAVLILKNTTLVSLIAVQDIVYYAVNVGGSTFHPLEFQTLVGLMFFAIITPLMALGRTLEKRLHSWG